MPTFLLFESALGYALFQRQEMEEIALSKLQQNILDYASFSKMIKFVSFAPFETPEHGLENANNISEGILHEFLENFLEMNLSKMKDVRLGLFESKLGGAIQESMKNVTCFTDDAVFELLRGIRFHIHKLIKGVKKGDVEKAQLGLSHAYSRAKVKFNVNKADNMIIQAIAMLDQLDKDVNTFSMRMREWYGWHFPELNKLVKDNASYSKIVLLIRDRATLTDESMDALTAITKDEQVSRAIVQAAKSSMGTDCSEYDMINIELFANKVVSLSDYQAELTHYLQTKMHDVAPNLTCLLGEKVGARLISKAGSMINLSKCPASTLQILGAEKALFRALKTRGNTPKYGLIYNSSFISKASKQNKGKISRYLANKCSVAVRIDSFQDTPTSKFGEMLRDQVEERLAYYEQGGKGVELKKNIDLMREVQKQVSADEEESMKEDAAPTQKSSIKRKRSSSEDDDEEQSTKKQKTETPSKKNKKSEDDVKTPESKSSSEEKKSSKKSDKKAKKAAKAAKKAEKAAKKKKE